VEKTDISPAATSRRSPGIKDGKDNLSTLLTVAELERASGVPSHVIRYYTRIGLLKPGRNPGNGYKLFGPAHLTRLLFIRRAKSLGCSLKEIREICRSAEKGKSPCPRVREIIENRVRNNREKLDSQLLLQTRMEKAVQAWRRLPDGVPDGDSICHLIETFPA